jgi:hypothetical protein
MKTDEMWRLGSGVLGAVLRVMTMAPATTVPKASHW